MSAEHVSEVRTQPRCYLDSSGQLNAGCLPARNQSDWETFLASRDTSRIRSRAAWDACVADPQCNPLRGVDPSIVQHFTDSLVFSGGGIAGADTSRIKRTLTVRQYAELWDGFGLALPLVADYDGYYCQGQGTCKVDDDAICTSNC